MNSFAEKSSKDVLTPGQRWLELMVIPGIALLLGFLVYHQVANTGFFTAKFGSLEMVCLYGPILLAVIAPTIRAVNGHRNVARRFEVASRLCLAVGSLWLLIVFPFNFAHLADTLPGPLRFVLAWVTDDLGRLLLLLQVIISPISALWAAFKFLSSRSHEPASLA